MVASLVELRVLEGPNLYFPRAAVKLTLDLAGLDAVSDEVALRFARRIGLANARPGQAGSGFRQRFAARAVAKLVRQVAAEAGTSRLAVRVRPTADVHQVVVAYPWSHRGRAEALGRAVAAVLDQLPATDVESLVGEGAAEVRRAEPGGRPTTIRPTIPVIAVTGTNGKTTTSRMIAHIARMAGLSVGWSSTDGIYLDGRLVEAGDYSGPSGAGRVLDQPGVQLAVTETARGGILLKGIGVRHNDISVVTNVSADHLGLQGIDTLDQLAEVKSVVTKITRATGWAVLNGDDPRVFGMRSHLTAPTWVFSRDPDSPAIREVVGHGGRATTVIDGWICVVAPRSDPDPVVRVVDVPMTLAGLSRFNVENALAACSAALGVGLPREAVVLGLTSFAPGPELNPGRMNVYSLDDITVVIDLAHNEAGLDALLEVMHGLCPRGSRTLLAVGTAGDRTDEVVRSIGEMAARGSDAVVIVHKQRCLRGRDENELSALYREGAEQVGVTVVPSFGTELAGLEALLDLASDRDVVAVMCHQDRPILEDWLRVRGATLDSPEVVRHKVLVAAGEQAHEAPGPASGDRLGWFNRLPSEEAENLLASCLAVPRWSEEVAARRPYASTDDLLSVGRSSAASLSATEADLALAGHPRIGEPAGPGHQAGHSRREQSGVDATDSAVSEALAEGNREYEARFGRIFLVRAAGRSAGWILGELRRRLANPPEAEAGEVANELTEIAIVRLGSLVDGSHRQADVRDLGGAE